MSAPAVAVSNKHNKYIVAWKDVRKGEPNIYWSISDRPEFKPGTVVHDSLNGTQDHPSVTIGTNGQGWIAWEDIRDGKHRIRVRSETSKSETVISGGIGNTSFPTIASGVGLIAVAFESTDDRQKNIYFSRFAQP